MEGATGGWKKKRGKAHRHQARACITVPTRGHASRCHGGKLKSSAQSTMRGSEGELHKITE